MANVLFVIAPENFRDEELFHTKEELERAGHVTTIASTRRGTAVGSMGGRADSTIDIAEARAGDFDAVVFVGGPGVEQNQLYENPAVLNLARSFFSQGKLTTAICIAPRILAKAGVLKGKKATFFPDPATARFVSGAGGIPSKADVEIDGKLITANGPRAAKKFGQAIAAALK